MRSSVFGLTPQIPGSYRSPKTQDPRPKPQALRPETVHQPGGQRLVEVDGVVEFVNGQVLVGGVCPARNPICGESRVVGEVRMITLVW